MTDTGHPFGGTASEILLHVFDGPGSRHCVSYSCLCLGNAFWYAVRMPKVAAKLHLTKQNYGLVNCSNYQVAANVNIRGWVKRK